MKGKPGVTRRSEAAKKMARDRMLGRQNAFLAAYGLTGSIRKGCEASEVTRGTVRRWRVEDICGFSDRFSDTEDDFRDMLQELAIDKVKNQGPKDNPVLHLAMLNAWWAERYKRTSIVVEESGKEALREFRKFIKESGTKGKSEGEEEKSDPVIQEAEDILARKSTSSRGQGPAAQA